MFFRRYAAVSAAALLIALPAQAAKAAPADEPVSGPDLTEEQRNAVEGFLDDPATQSEPAKPKSGFSTAATERAVRWRGTPLLYVEDSVTFGYNWWKVTWTDGGSQSSRNVFPNTVKNWGINRYYHTTTQHRFRGSHTVGAGTVTPWGDVNIYSWSVINRLKIHHNGAWKTWTE